MIRDISIALTPPRLDDSMDITPPNSPDVTVPELSFNVTARDIEMPEQHEEVSLLDEPPALIDPGDDVRDVHITYEVVEGGTIRGKPMLVESSGYTYTIKRIRGPTTEWWCTIRGKALRCHATVRQRGDAFTKGRHDHIHPADPGALKTTKVKVSVKSQAAQDIFKSAATIVQDTLNDEVQHVDPEPLPSLPAPANLIRTAKRLWLILKQVSTIN